MERIYSADQINIMKKILEAKKVYDTLGLEILGLQERIELDKEAKVKEELRIANEPDPEKKKYSFYLPDTSALPYLQLRKAEQDLEKYHINTMLKNIKSEAFKNEITQACSLEK